MKTLEKNNIRFFESSLNNTRLVFTYDKSKLWFSLEDLSRFFGLDLHDFIIYVDNYLFLNNLDKDDHIKTIYDKTTDNYVAFLNLDFIISIGYRLKMYGKVKDIISFSRYTKIKVDNFFKFTSEKNYSLKSVSDLMKNIGKLQSFLIA